MNGLNKLCLAGNLAKLASFYCSYKKFVDGKSVGASPNCKCHFIAPENEPKFGSQNGCGCPEMSQACEILQSMTDIEFRRICKRAGIDIPGVTYRVKSDPAEGLDQKNDPNARPIEEFISEDEKKEWDEYVKEIKQSRIFS